MYIFITTYQLIRKKFWQNKYEMVKKEIVPLDFLFVLSFVPKQVIYIYFHEETYFIYHLYILWIGIKGVHIICLVGKVSTTVCENIIGTLKIWNNLWYPIKLLNIKLFSIAPHFSYCSFNFERIVALTSYFHILYQVCRLAFFVLLFV